jgi:hypothetical protein
MSIDRAKSPKTHRSAPNSQSGGSGGTKTPTTPQNGARGALWRVEDVARFLNVSRAHVYVLKDVHGLPFRLIPQGILRFDPDEVRAWSESFRQTM